MVVADDGRKETIIGGGCWTVVMPARCWRSSASRCWSTCICARSDWRSASVDDDEEVVTPQLARAFLVSGPTLPYGSIGSAGRYYAVATLPLLYGALRTRAEVAAVIVGSKKPLRDEVPLQVDDIIAAGTAGESASDDETG